LPLRRPSRPCVRRRPQAHGASPCMNGLSLKFARRARRRPDRLKNPSPHPPPSAAEWEEGSRRTAAILPARQNREGRGSGRPSNHLIKSLIVLARGLRERSR
jgi:hypothetical protein